MRAFVILSALASCLFVPPSMGQEASKVCVNPTGVYLAFPEVECDGWLPDSPAYVITVSPIRKGWETEWRSLKNGEIQWRGMLRVESGRLTEHQVAWGVEGWYELLRLTAAWQWDSEHQRFIYSTLSIDGPKWHLRNISPKQP